MAAMSKAGAGGSRGRRSLDSEEVPRITTKNTGNTTRKGLWWLMFNVVFCIGFLTIKWDWSVISSLLISSIMELQRIIYIYIYFFIIYIYILGILLWYVLGYRLTNLLVIGNWDHHPVGTSANGELVVWTLGDRRDTNARDEKSDERCVYPLVI